MNTEEEKSGVDNACIRRILRILLANGEEPKLQSPCPDGRFYAGISDLTLRATQRENNLLCFIWELALAQNPELAQELEAVRAERERLDDMRRAEKITLYHEWKAKRDAEHRAARHIRYDDRRNINKLTALRRTTDYKRAPRLEQIRMEIERYWTPYSQPVPKEIMSELRRLESRQRRSEKMRAVS